MRLLMASADSVRVGGDLILYGARPLVMEVFELLEVADRLNFLPNREQALA